MRDLLLRSVFQDHKVALFELAHDAGGLLLQNQCINCYQVNVYFNDLGRLARRPLISIDSSIAGL